MFRLIKIILLFEIGLLLGVFVISPRQYSKVLPISSHLPDLVIPDQGSTFTIIFTGDVMLGRSVNTRIQKYSDPTWPFKNIATLLSKADLAVINLESPFISDCRPTDGGMIFCADPKNIFGLVFAGVDYASLANNHINNQGKKGVDETIDLLKSNSITPLGLGKPEFNILKNIKIALLAFTDLPELDEKEMIEQISESTQSADLVLINFHWGAEYQQNPTSRQVYLAHLAIDSGADLVVGHHPHWVQTEEIYQGKPIYYSLGNLVFDQMWSEETRLGEILRLTYQDTQLIKKEIFPIKIFDYGQPNFYPTSDLK